MKSAVVASIALIVTATQAALMRKRNLAPQHKSLNAPEERIQSDEAYDPFMGMKDRKLAGHVGSMPHGHEEGEEHHESMSMSMKPSEPVPSTTEVVTEAPSRCVEQVEVPTTHAAKQSCLAETVKTRCGTPTSPLEPPITIPLNLTRSFSSHQCFNGRNVRCVCPGCRRHVPVSVMRHFWLKVLQRLDVVLIEGRVQVKVVLTSYIDSDFVHTIICDIECTLMFVYFVILRVPIVSLYDNVQCLFLSLSLLWSLRLRCS